MDPEDEREVLDSFFLLLAINSFSFWFHLFNCWILLFRANLRRS
jgi:hypothetical protein